MARREDETQALDIARRPGGGGWAANLTALTALAFSAFSFYETVWKAEDVRVFVAPQIAFSDPANGPFDVFEIPVTLANSGARDGVALSFALEVVNPRSGERKLYHSAQTGAWRAAWEGGGAAFAPLSVPGGEALTRRILFFPRAEEAIDRLVSEAGVYRFTLTMNVAPVDRLADAIGVAADAATSLSFDMLIDDIDYRRFNQGGTIPLRTADYAPVVSD